MTLPEDDAVSVPSSRGFRRRVTRGRIAAGAIVLALGGLWVARYPIVEGFVDRTLAARGVPARYRITKLALGRQILHDVSIGDPAAPDLIARRVVLTIEVGTGGPYVKSIAAEGVRLRGRIVGGTLHMGAVDKLLPVPSGAPFALPDLVVRLTDARMRLETPAGVVGLAVEGAGNLSDGFTGRVAARARALKAGGCVVAVPAAVLNVSIAKRRPSLDGPLSAARIDCGAVTVTKPLLALDAALGPALDRWDGAVLAELAGVRAPGLLLGRTGGRIGFVGDAARTTGILQLRGEQARTAAADAASIAIDGRYLALPRARAGRYEGGVEALALAPPETRLAGFARAGAAGAGTPVGPIAAALGDAIARAGRSVDVRATLAAQLRGQRGTVRVSRLSAASASGVRATAEGEFAYGWPGGALRTDGRATFGGGGLPAGTLTLRQAAPAAPLTGVLVAAPIVAPGARLALAPVRFTAADGATRFATALTLDGPVADGRVTALNLPVAGRIGRSGALVVNAQCVPLRFESLSIAGATISATRLPLCPAGGALVSRSARGVVTGGGRIAAPFLRGRLGGQPLTIAARQLGFAVDRPGFVADALAVRLGQGEAVTRLDAARLAGTFGPGGIAGRFAGLGGQIARVPLVLSQGAGDWRLAHAVLDLDGGVRVADEAAAPRFEPLASDDFHLRLADAKIVAGGWLKTPAGGAKVTQVAIRHDLRGGNGGATLDVPGITFSESLQPEALTRLTLGVIANVRGTVSGRGQIAWNGLGVTSTGTFGTEATDLAAAFGPVKGIATQVHFTDLLGLVSAPAQVATIAEVNPGIAATGGVVRYRLLADQKVAVESARWPFSGGELELEPTVLDFSGNAVRRMRFRVTGVDAAKFVEQFDFKNVSVTGTFDGVVPITFDATGGRIEGGRLAVRKAGGVLAYVGEISNKDLGMMGSLAFDALKRMRYRSLVIELGGPLDGELVSRLLFDGTNETPKDAVHRSGLLSQVTNLPFRFRITIRAPFRGLLNSARSLNDPRGLIDQALPKAEPALPGSSSSVVVTPETIQSR